MLSFNEFYQMKLEEAGLVEGTSIEENEVLEEAKKGKKRKKNSMAMTTLYKNGLLRRL